LSVAVEKPASAAQAAAVLSETKVTRPVGGRTKLDWGAVGSPAEVELSTERLSELVEHNEGDFTAILQAGVKLSDAQAAFARAGQRLVLDPPDPEGKATIGGVLATSDSGPLRHRYGGARDLVLGIQVALPDGTVARAGSRVIKNVAGYDLAKLMCGAHGTLGVICEVILRLHPVPPQTVTVLARGVPAAQLGRAASALRRHPFELESLDVGWSDGSGSILARAAGRACESIAGEVTEVLSAEGLESEVVDDDDALWEEQRTRQRGEAIVRVSFPPAELERLLVTAPRAVARAGAGLGWVAIEPTADALARLRGELAPWPCVLLDAPESLRADVDPWGVGDGPEAALMLRQGAVMSVWDSEQAPSVDLLDDCVHCGFCLPTCPTYALWGEEMDSPRGRIQIMGLGHKQDELSDEMVTHLDQCLGCMACVTACPSGVKYDHLLLQARPQIERHYDRSPADRAFRRLIFEVFPHPGRLRAMVPLLALQRRLGGERLIPRRLRRLRGMAALTPEVKLRSMWSQLPEVTPAKGEKRGTVALLQGCVQRVFFSQVNRATVRVLAAEGFEVHAPREPRCCGSLQLHTGYEEAARERARDTVNALGGYDTVIVNAAGCGSGMKDYVHLIDDSQFAAKVKDVFEFLADVEPRAQRRPLALKVAYHDACHLAHAQGIRRQPRDLLRAVPELELLEPAEWELCCGSAGVYNMLMPDAAADLGRRKADNLAATRPDVIAAANPGCLIQINRYLDRPVPMVHPIELLARSVR
jgi:glycolate oxidase iron-sulfur subunit